MERSMVKLSLWGSKCNIGTYEFTIKKNDRRAERVMVQLRKNHFQVIV